MMYDVFISYRRQGAGAGVAGELQAKLENLGYKVFLDVDSIGSGDFPEQIEEALQQCNDFLLILSPNMLDRCVNEEDWVRHEILLAEKYGKNVIGISLPGFTMPAAESLPSELRGVPEKQVFIWSHEYRHASFDKIVENMLSTALKKKRAKRKYLWIAAFMALAVAGGAWWLVPAGDDAGKLEESTKKNEELVDYRKVFIQAVNDTFASFLHAGDSLLQLVPSNPSNQQDFEVFMQGINEYGAALAYEKQYPGVVSNLTDATKRMDSLLDLRANRFNYELEATSKFLEVGQVDFARYRYDNALVLALDEDAQSLEAVGKKFPKE